MLSKSMIQGAIGLMCLDLERYVKELQVIKDEMSDKPDKFYEKELIVLNFRIEEIQNKIKRLIETNI
jgi:hypothetical protein